MVATGTTVTAFFLTVGFCFYGMNPLNLLPFVLGVFVYSRIKRQPFAGSSISPCSPRLSRR